MDRVGDSVQVMAHEGRVMWSQNEVNDSGIGDGTRPGIVICDRGCFSFRRQKPFPGIGNPAFGFLDEGTS